MTPALLDRSLFVPDGDGWMPTAYSRGPWSPDALHGGPVAALLVREIEAVPAPVPARLTRVTVELLRPVPLASLTVSTEIVRPGAKVATLEAEVRRSDDGTLLALARAQRIRVADVEFPADPVEEVPDLPTGPSDVSAWPGSSDVAFHSTAAEHRVLRGSISAPGPVFDWVRLLVPVTPDEVPSGWQRAAATADFTNGLSAVVPWDGQSMFINPDLTVHLWREPVGEWIGTDAVTRVSSSGIGTSDTALWDRSGRVGRGMQSLLLDRT